jgi:hypothetical protein
LSVGFRLFLPHAEQRLYQRVTPFVAVLEILPQLGQILPQQIGSVSPELLLNPLTESR